jgi:hypothetical protein
MSKGLHNNDGSLSVGVLIGWGLVGLTLAVPLIIWAVRGY